MNTFRDLLLVIKKTKLSLTISYDPIKKQFDGETKTQNGDTFSHFTLPYISLRDRDVPDMWFNVVLLNTNLNEFLEQNKGE